MPSEIKSESMIRYARELYLTHDKINPSRKAYTFGQIVELIKDRFGKKVGTSTLHRWSKRNGWSKDWNKAQLEASIEAAQNDQELTTEAVDIIRCNSKSYVFDIENNIEKATAQIDEILSIAVDSRTVLVFERLARGVSFLMHALTEKSEVDLRYLVELKKSVEDPTDETKNEYVFEWSEK